METKTPTTYPQYFRKAGRCMKRESDTTTIEVRVPTPGNRLPTDHHPVTYPSKLRLDEEVSKMEITDEATYESFLFTLWQQSKNNHELMTQIKEKRLHQQVGHEREAVNKTSA